MENFERKLRGMEYEDTTPIEFSSVGPDGEIDMEEFSMEEFNPEELSTEVNPVPSPAGEDILQDALGSIATYVDIVFGIDLTGSMIPVLKTVKSLALNFYDELIEDMREKNNRVVEKLRVKVIGYRDFYCDGPYALEESSFFTLPDQKEEFSRFVNSLEAKGGGDEPENSLEALALAMKTDWVKAENLNSERARNVIVIFTDTSAHPLEKALGGVSNPLYPSDMAKSYMELYEAWNGQAGCESGADQYNMDQRAKRLVVFAPEDAYPWNEVAEEFDKTAVVSISMDKGGEEIGRQTIISTISGSIE